MKNQFLLVLLFVARRFVLPVSLQLDHATYEARALRLPRV